MVSQYMGKYMKIIGKGLTDHIITFPQLNVSISNSFCEVAFLTTRVYILKVEAVMWSMNQMTSPVVWLQDDAHKSPPNP